MRSLAHYGTELKIMNQQTQRLLEMRTQHIKDKSIKQMEERIRCIDQTILASSGRQQANASGPIKVLIDMQAMQGLSRFRGLGRFAESFAKAMCNADYDISIHLLFNARLESSCADSFIDLVGEQNIHFFDAEVPTADANPDFTSNRPLAKAIYRAKVNDINPDILHNPSFFEGYGDDCISDITEYPGKWKVVVTLHDLIPYMLQKEYLNDYPSYKQHYMSTIEEFKTVKTFVSISEHSKQEAVRELGILPDCITVCSSAVDEDFINTIPTNACQKFNINKKYILYTGGPDARKNLFRLIDAYGTLPRKVRNEYQLVIAGPMDTDNAHLLHGHYRQYVDKSEVKLLNYVDNADLVGLYKNASLYVFPSYSEGFGLPLIEAMRFGVPVICSGCSSMVEIVDFEPCYFNPFSVQSIRNKLIEGLTDDSLRSSIIEHGHAQASKFSWDKTIEKTWNVYMKILGRCGYIKQ